MLVVDQHLRWEAGACLRMNLDWTARSRLACSASFPRRWKSTKSKEEDSGNEIALVLSAGCMRARLDIEISRVEEVGWSRRRESEDTDVSIMSSTRCLRVRLLGKKLIRAMWLNDDTGEEGTGSSGRYWRSLHSTGGETTITR